MPAPAGPPSAATCRLCGAPLRAVFADLGSTPLANAYLRPEQLSEPEARYPLRALVCERCRLVQLEAFAAPEIIFSDYAYFSSYSDTLLAESKRFADDVAKRLALGAGDRVIEIASNDGYLLQYFQQTGAEVLGIEPAANVAEAARRKGIPTRVVFFGKAVAEGLVAEGLQARLVVANNVLAHVPNLNDFIAGMKRLLAPRGTITIEFHHLLSLIVHRQFDTIYHEHFQYFSLATARAALSAHGLAIVDVETLSSQGGSLRVYACHDSDVGEGPSERVAAVLASEEAAGLTELPRYLKFAEQVDSMKRGVPAFLTDIRKAGKSVVGYGAAAKGNTLLNACGIGPDLVEYVVDRNPHKQGRFLPGSHIPIHAPEKVAETKPDYLLILPWNLRDEIVAQMSSIRAWGGQFVVPIPDVEVVP